MVTKHEVEHRMFIENGAGVGRAEKCAEKWSEIRSKAPHKGRREAGTGDAVVAWVDRERGVQRVGPRRKVGGGPVPLGRGGGDGCSCARRGIVVGVARAAMIRSVELKHQFGHNTAEKYANQREKYLTA